MMNWYCDVDGTQCDSTTFYYESLPCRIAEHDEAYVQMEIERKWRREGQRKHWIYLKNIVPSIKRILLSPVRIFTHRKKRRELVRFKARQR